MILVISTNSNTCRFYDYDRHHLNLSKEITHPANKLKNSELVSDRPGHYQAPDASRGAYSPHMDAKEVEVDRFAREIANELNRARNQNHYLFFVLISPAHMLGEINKHIDKHVKALMKCVIQKDLMNSPERELIEVLQEHLL